MVEIPTPYGRRRTPSFVSPVARLQDAGGAARALGEVGAAFQQASNVSFEIQEREREEESAARALEAEQNVAQKYRELMHDPEKGFLNTSQRIAVEGRDAVIERVREINDGALEGLDDRTAKRLGPALAARMESALGQIDRHTSAQRLSWLSAGSQARVATAADSAARSPYDESVIEESLKVGVQELESTAVREGWTVEEFSLKRKSFVSSTLRNVAIRRATEDPVAAMAFVKANKHRLSADDMSALERTLTPAVKQYEGRQLGASAAQGGSSGVSPALFGLLKTYESGGDYSALFGFSNREGGAFSSVNVQNMTVDEVIEFSRGTNQYGQWVKGKIGRVATPMGAGQIVGTTLRGLVDEMGIPGDTKFTPELQNAMITHLARRRIQPGMSQAEKREALRSEWEGFSKASDAALDKAISEIENNVGAKPSDNPLGDILAIDDPVKRDAALAEYRRITAMREGEVKRARHELEAAVFEHVEGGGSVEDLPVEIRAGLGRTEMAGLRSYEANRAAGIPTRTDDQTLYSLSLMATSRPDEFATMNLLEYRDKLSDSDWRSMIAKQMKARETGDADATYGGIKTAVNRVMPGTYDFNAEPDTTDGERAQRLWMGMKREIDAYVSEHQKMPGEAEQMDMVRRLLTEVEYRGPLNAFIDAVSIFGTDPNDSVSLVELTEQAETAFESGQPLEAAGMTITAEGLNQVVEGYVAEGGQQPRTLSEALHVYLRAMGKLR